MDTDQEFNKNQSERFSELDFSTTTTQTKIKI